MGVNVYGFRRVFTKWAFLERKEEWEIQLVGSFLDGKTASFVYLVSIFLWFFNFFWSVMEEGKCGKEDLKKKTEENPKTRFLLRIIAVYDPNWNIRELSVAL